MSALSHLGRLWRHLLGSLILCNVLIDDNVIKKAVGRMGWQPLETIVVRWKLIDCNCFAIVLLLESVAC